MFFKALKARDISKSDLVCMKDTPRQSFNSCYWNPSSILLLPEVGPIAQKSTDVSKTNSFNLHGFIRVPLKLQEAEYFFQFRLELSIGQFRNPLEIRRKAVGLCQLSLQPRHNLALDGERRKRNQDISNRIRISTWATKCRDQSIKIKALTKSP